MVKHEIRVNAGVLAPKSTGYACGIADAGIEATVAARVLHAENAES